MIDINNFSLALTEYIECDEGVSFEVDVTTTSGIVTTSGTYFTYNGVIVDTQYSTITNGYRLSYFTVPSGNIFLDVYAENSIAEFASETYEFYYGYNCEYNKVVNYGNDKIIPVTIEATNDVIVPNTEYISTFFGTKLATSYNLGAEISTEGSAAIDLTASIRPQSKYFEYGKTYSITVSNIKDFNGNVMEEQTFTFTIENENEN